MKPKFIRLLRERENAEVLLNVNTITRIKVTYAIRGEKENQAVNYTVGLKEGMTNPQAFRVYTIFVGGTEYKLVAKPGSRVMQVLEDIYKNAIRDD